MSGLLLWDPPPCPPRSSFSCTVLAAVRPPTPPPLASQSPVLSARPIVLQTAQVMINTNTQQWELQAHGQRGIRETRGWDAQTASSLPRRHKRRRGESVRNVMSWELEKRHTLNKELEKEKALMWGTTAGDRIQNVLKLWKTAVFVQNSLQILKLMTQQSVENFLSYRFKGLKRC